MNKTPRLYRVHSLVALLVAALSSPALAQQAPDPPGPVAPPAASPQAEAERHFKRGLELYDDDDFQGARVEFLRAYQLAPNYRVLYNVGQVDFQLQDYTGALRAFDQYLREGGAEIPRPRRDDVERDLGKLRARIATVEVAASPGAVVTVDGVLAGTAPLGAPLQVSEGRRVLRASLGARAPVEKTLELAGGDSTRVDLDFHDLLALPEMPPPPAPARSTPWALWGVAGALGVGTIVTGVLALAASSSASNLRAGGGSFSDYQSDQQRMRAFSVTTDALGAATLVIAGLATYLTFTAGPRKAGTGGLAPRVAEGTPSPLRGVFP